MVADKKYESTISRASGKIQYKPVPHREYIDIPTQVILPINGR
ncbi:hypothetical protein 7t3_0317 [Salmonella phage 7t3]|nr:hypothetical protein 7t3_0317 [Salmonella phage 7t3]